MSLIMVFPDHVTQKNVIRWTNSQLIRAGTWARPCASLKVYHRTLISGVHSLKRSPDLTRSQVKKFMGQGTLLRKANNRLKGRAFEKQ